MHVQCKVLRSPRPFISTQLLQIWWPSPCACMCIHDVQSPSKHTLRVYYSAFMFVTVQLAFIFHITISMLVHHTHILPIQSLLSLLSLSLSHTHTHTHTHTPQRAHASLRRLSTSDVATSSSAPTTDQSVTDDLQNHIMLNAPKKGEVDVPLGSSITVHFDKDVKTVNINKLFEASDDVSECLLPHSLSPRVDKSV